MNLVRTSTDTGFDVLTLDSPQNRNALSVAMLTEMISTVTASAAGGSRGLLITHAGPAFCAGVDLKERAHAGPTSHEHSDLLCDLLRQLLAYPKPVVAYLHGAVRGGGMGLIACADIVIATTAATFAYSEARVGVAPALVLAATFAARAADRLMPYVLDGAMFDAAEAHRIGLVDFVEQDDADEPKHTLSALRQAAPAAQRTAKRAYRQWRGVDTEALLDKAVALSAELFATPEAAEGAAAFVDRRPPSWVADGSVSTSDGLQTPLAAANSHQKSDQ